MQQKEVYGSSPRNQNPMRSPKNANLPKDPWEHDGPKDKHHSFQLQINQNAHPSLSKSVQLEGVQLNKLEKSHVAQKIFSVLNKQDNYQHDSELSSGSEGGSEDQDDEKAHYAKDEGFTDRAKRKKLAEQQIVYQNALEYMEVQVTNENDQAQNEMKEEMQQEYEEELIKYQAEHVRFQILTHQQINFSEMFRVEHKNEFEMLEMYTDSHPLLQQRKKVMFVMKLISFVCFYIIKHPLFETVILLIILFNTTVLMLDDPTNENSSEAMIIIEDFFLIAYTVEMSLKIVGMGFVLNKGAYLRDGWNILDFVIVTTSLLPLFLGGDSSSVNLSSLRSLRVLRPLRTISSIRALKVLLVTLFNSIPALLNTIIILFFFFLIFAIGAVQLYKGILKQSCFSEEHGIRYFHVLDFVCGGETDCNAPSELYGKTVFMCGKMLENPQFGVMNFDTIFYSFLMVFQVVTMEGWTDIMYAVFDAFTIFTVVYFVVLLFVGAFFLLNLTLAVIKTSYSNAEHKDDDKKKLEGDPLEGEEINEEALAQQQMENLQKEKEQAEQEEQDSDEDIAPDLEEMKQFKRQQRLQHYHSKQDSQNTYGANTLKDINFVFEDMIALRQKLEEELKQKEEKERQDRLIQQYLEHQKKQMEKLKKSSKHMRPMKKHPFQYTLQMFSNLGSDRRQQHQPINVQLDTQSDNKSEEQSPARKNFQRKNSIIAPQTISRSDSRELSEFKRDYQRHQTKKATYKEKSALIKKSSDMSEKRKTIYQPQRQESKGDGFDFDIILQDLEDLPDPKVQQARKNRIKLRSKKSDQTMSHTMTQTFALKERGEEEHSSILSDSNDESQFMKVETIAPFSPRQMPDEPHVPKSSKIINKQDHNDLLDDSDFLANPDDDKPNEITLAQTIFQRNILNLQKRQQKKLHHLEFQKKRRYDPKINQFIILGLQRHIRNASKDNDQTMKFADFLSHTQEESNKDEEVDDKKKKERKKGSPHDYKLVLSIDREFYSVSHHDVQEKKIKQREQARFQKLANDIKNKKYILIYNPLEEDEKRIREYNEQAGGGANAEQPKTHSASSTFQSMTLVHNDSDQMELILQSWHFPISRGGFIQRRKFYLDYKQSRFEHDQLFLERSSSTLLNKSARHSSSHKFKRRKQQQKAGLPEVDITNFRSVTRAIHEPVQEKVHPYMLANDKIYMQILQDDYHSGIKNALHWSGEDVLQETKITPKRANKCRLRMSTPGQDKVIYLAGVMGFMAVRHKELGNFVKSKLMENFLTTAVIFNTVILAMNGLFHDDESLATMELFNEIFTFIFIGEMGLKIIAFGPLGYVRDKMNIFDGCIVILSIMEMTFLSGSGGKAVSAFRAVRIFRTFRVLRVTRLLRSLAFMQVIIQVVLSTIENFMYISILMFLFVIIYALLGMQMYGGSFNFRDNIFRGSFDDFQQAFLVVFQLLTLENWGDILILTFRTDFNKFITAIYLISWIFIGNWVFLNLFLTILIDGFSAALDSNALEQEQVNVDEDGQYFTKIENMIYSHHPELDEQRKEVEQEIQKQEKERRIQQQQEQQAAQQNLMPDVEIDLVEHKARVRKPLYEGIECEDSLYIFSKKNPFRILMYRVVSDHNFENVILLFIVVSSLKLAVDTYIQEGTETKRVSDMVDIGFNVIFALEATMKIIAYGLFMDNNSYLTESWSQLDCFIVISSLIDMAFENINLPVIKILRLLRILRPLRFISHNVNMKMVVIALLDSLGGMINVIIVVTLIFLMFAILGISLIGGRLGYCDVKHYYGINYDQCVAQGNQWRVFSTNFDNIYYAMNTLFVVSSLEGWPDIMHPCMDSDYKEYGPSKDNFAYISYYFVLFILIGSFFLINLFVGVICFYFERASKNEQKVGGFFLTDEQKNWIEIQRMTIGVKVEYTQRPTNQFRGRIYDLVKSGYFDAFIMLCIILNILTMAMAFEGSKVEYDTALENINLGFTSVFIFETSMKIIAYGPKDFWASGWNQFDLFVVISSLVDLTLKALGGSSISFLRVGPQLIRIVRVLRVTRLLKLVKSMRGLQKLIETILYSLPSLINIGALLFLVYFIYSILGVFLFSEVNSGETVHKYNNFNNFGLAMITLFRVSTGENWHLIMFDMMEGSPFSPLYFISFILICTFVMLNLFILIIIQYFETYNLKKDNPLDVFQDNLEVFRQHWLRYTEATLGLRLNQQKLPTFFATLPPPLGFGKSKKQTIAKEIMAMQLIGDGYGNVYFNELLFAALKRVFQSKNLTNTALNLELQNILGNAELETRRLIEHNKMRDFKKRQTKFIPAGKSNPINPLVSYLMNQMAFLAWKNYTALKKEGNETPLTSEDENDDSQKKELDKVEEGVSCSEQNDDDTVKEVQNEENDQVVMNGLFQHTPFPPVQSPLNQLNQQSASDLENEALIQDRALGSFHNPTILELSKSREDDSVKPQSMNNLFTPDASRSQSAFNFKQRLPNNSDHISIQADGYLNAAFISDKQN